MSDFKLVKLLNSPVVIEFPNGINYAGDYSNATAYVIGDVVSYNGSSYVAITSTTGNIPTNTSFWQLLASKGDTGATGATGASGANGTNGTNGADGADGAPGVGVPTGGTAGQVLSKIDGTDYNTEWVDQSIGVTDHTLLTNIGTNTHAQIDTHIANTSNPHGVTKAQVGLGNVDNTSDADKPVSTAQATAIGLKENSSNKTTNFTANTGSNTLFPTVKAIYDALVGYLANYEPLLGYTPAKQDLSNLTGTAINQALVPESDATFDIGSTINRWYSAYFTYLRNTSDNITVDIESSLLNDTSGNKSVDAQERLLVDGTNLTSVDWKGRSLRDSAEKRSIEYNDRLMLDASEKKSIDYSGRALLDDAEIISVNYQQRTLRDSGTANSIDWQNRLLLDDAELTSINYLDRQLKASDGTTINLDWSQSSGATSITQSPNDNSTKLATTAYVDAQPKTIIKKFTTSGTYTVPTSPAPRRITAVVRAGSGGGGSGRRGAAGTNRFGGGSGVAASLCWMQFNPSYLTPTVTITVGSGGAGGAARTTDDTDGALGASGGVSSFGSYLKSPTSAGGGAGTTTTGAAGTAQQTLAGMFSNPQVAGSVGASGTGTTGPIRTDFTTTSSGGGAGIAVGNGSNAGGSGGQWTVNAIAPTTSGGAGGIAGGGDGGDTVFSGVYFLGVPMGTGAGGGGSAGGSAIRGGNGGNGYTSGGIHTGAAGGGGAASLNGNLSGDGGRGSDGIVVVIEEY